MKNIFGSQNSIELSANDAAEVAYRRFPRASDRLRNQLQRASSRRTTLDQAGAPSSLGCAPPAYCRLASIRSANRMLCEIVAAFMLLMETLARGRTCPSNIVPRSNRSDNAPSSRVTWRLAFCYERGAWVGDHRLLPRCASGGNGRISRRRRFPRRAERVR